MDDSNLWLSSGAPAASTSVRIAVCVCTFRRPDGLRALLEGLGRQRFQRVPARDLGGRRV